MSSLITSESKYRMQVIYGVYANKISGRTHQKLNSRCLWGNETETEVVIDRKPFTIYFLLYSLIFAMSTCYGFNHKNEPVRRYDLLGAPSALSLSRIITANTELLFFFFFFASVTRAMLSTIYTFFLLMFTTTSHGYDTRTPQPLPDEETQTETT